MSTNQGNNTNQHFFAAEAAVKSNGIESTHIRESGQDDSMEISKERNNTQNSSCSDRKRNRRTMADDGSLDDILGQITSKLKNLTASEDNGEQDSIKAFTDVLNCSAPEAQFFLESSNWNVETAAMLWLENNPLPSLASTYLPGLVAFGCGDANSNPFVGGRAVARTTPIYQSKQVHIPDLTEGWIARVSKSSGQIYFVHLATGTTQFSVPPGYADATREDFASSTNTAAGAGAGSAMDSSTDAGDTQSASNRSVNDSRFHVSDGIHTQDIAVEPTSPIGLAPCTYPENAMLGRSNPGASGIKYNSAASSFTVDESVDMEGIAGIHRRGDRGNNVTSSSAFRDSMDAFVTEDTSSVHAVWDEGSGYSLNDPVFSISSSTINSESTSPVFSTISRMYPANTAGGDSRLNPDYPLSNQNNQHGFMNSSDSISHSSNINNSNSSNGNSCVGSYNSRGYINPYAVYPISQENHSNTVHTAASGIAEPSASGNDHNHSNNNGNSDYFLAGCGSEDGGQSG